MTTLSVAAVNGEDFIPAAVSGRFGCPIPILPALRDRVKTRSEHLELAGLVVPTAGIFNRGTCLLEIHPRHSVPRNPTQNVLALDSHGAPAPVDHLKVRLSVGMQVVHVVHTWSSSKRSLKMVLSDAPAHCDEEPNIASENVEDIAVREIEDALHAVTERCATLLPNSA